MWFNFNLDFCSELELLILLLLFEFVMEKDLKNIDSIYNYTESHVKSLEESITRIDNRFNTFIGFSAVLIRLCLDLPRESFFLQIVLCLLCISAIIVGAIGLQAKEVGNVLHPSALMEDKYFEEDEVFRQCLIINDKIELINEYEKVIQKKGKRLNLIISLFSIAVILYGIGIIGLGYFSY